MNDIFFRQSTGQEQKRETPREKSLLNAAGVQVGQAIEWAHGNMPSSLTERERRNICAALGVKKINEPRCLEIKRCMATMTCARIVKHFKGRRGFSESWITKVHAALSRG